MKIVAVLLIAAYLLFPAVCSGDPCGITFAVSLHECPAADFPGDAPIHHDSDSCETTCCCAGHIPPAGFAGVPRPDLTERELPKEPLLALPRLSDRIFVPPQNRS